MYVCICNAIRDSDIRAASESGIGCAAEYFRSCGVKPQCGQCVIEVQNAIRTRLTEPAG